MTRAATTEMYEVAKRVVEGPDAYHPDGVRSIPLATQIEILHEFVLLYREHQALEHAKEMLIPITKGVP